MTLRKSIVHTMGALSLLMASQPVMAQVKEVEVVHWWTSGGEAAALNVLKGNLQKQGISWKDNPIAGGGGTQAMTVLRARVTSGSIPTSVQMLGFDIQDWAALGSLGDLNEIAAKEGWDKVVPKALQRFSKFDGKWVAAPVNVHSTNWVWANKAVLDKLGIAVPKTYEEFIAALDKAKAGGVVALAHGGQPWQDATLFDAILLSVGGADFYKKSMIDLDAATLKSPEMKTVFERMAKLRTYVDPNFSGRDWNLASAMVIKGEAAFQMMGDWAKGEFISAGKKPDTDFLCFRFPGTQGLVTFNSDQFVMFKVGDDRKDAQAKMASAVMDPAFQSAFNVVKGSAPARTDVPNDAFDACGKKAMADLKDANDQGKLFGSMAHGHANPAGVKQAMYDVITAHFNGQLDTAKAPDELAKAVAAAK
jgi:glucose/mannose transport system substrate-binding protein